MIRKKKLYIALFFYVFGAMGLLFGSFFEFKNEAYILNSTKREYNSLFSSNKPKESISLRKVDSVKKKVKKLPKYNEKDKKVMLSDLNNFKKYIDLKNRILNNYSNNCMNSSLSINEINKYKKESKSITKKYRKILNKYINSMYAQRRNIDKVEKSINSIFTDAEKNDIKDGITKDKVEELRATLVKLPQADIVQKYTSILDKAVNIINRKEIEKRIRAILDAWVTLNVPYISQNKNNVLNGCEAASLLMGLKFKGYLGNMDYVKFATDMPKSSGNNPYQGFTHDIFGFAPGNVPHWIAPVALAAYGRNSSGNPNVIDGTGMSLEQLDRELDYGNPVVIYATAKFKTPKAVVEGAPKNLHVMLLTGYNKITKQHIITDPWTYDDGRTSWTLEKNELESIYDAVGRKNVIIR